jgi:hypothetical protein
VRVSSLDRNVFPMFSGGVEQSAHVATSAGAELGRLPEPLLLRIAPFLTGKGFCGMTQSNKVQRGLSLYGKPA